jgi:hypothetical protein
MRTLISALSLSAAVLVAPAAGAQQPARHTISGNDIAIYNLAGQVRVEPGTGSGVVVDVQTLGRDASKLRVETGPVRGRSTLRVIYPDDRIVYPALEGSSTSLSVRDDGTFSDGDSRGGGRTRITSSGSGLEAHADLRVLVPQGQRVTVYLATGTVDVTNVNATLVVDVHSADVTARGVRGVLSIDTGSGNIEVSDIAADLDLDTGSGDVRVNGARGSRHRIDTGSGSVVVSGLQGDRIVVDVGSGDIEVRGLSAATVRLDSGSGSVDAELSGELRDLVVDTGSGDVTLRLPKDFGAELDVDTGSGSIRSAFAVTTRELQRDALRGTIGDGRARVKVDTGSGSVSLLQN